MKIFSAGDVRGAAEPRSHANKVLAEPPPWFLIRAAAVPSAGNASALNADGNARSRILEASMPSECLETQLWVESCRGKFGWKSEKEGELAIVIQAEALCSIRFGGLFVEA